MWHLINSVKGIFWCRGPPSQWVPANLPGGRRSEHEVHHLQQYNALVKNEWSLTCGQPIRLHGVVLRHKVNFTFKRNANYWNYTVNWTVIFGLWLYYTFEMRKIFICLLTLWALNTWILQCEIHKINQIFVYDSVKVFKNKLSAFSCHKEPNLSCLKQQP
jgi:hypothetical protein